MPSLDRSDALLSLCFFSPQICSSVHRQQLLVALMMHLSQQFSGINAVSGRRSGLRPPRPGAVLDPEIPPRVPRAAERHAGSIRIRSSLIRVLRGSFERSKRRPGGAWPRPRYVKLRPMQTGNQTLTAKCPDSKDLCRHSLQDSLRLTL